MASDFFKGVLLGGLIGSGSGSPSGEDKLTAEALRRQSFLAEEAMRRDDIWNDQQTDAMRWLSRDVASQLYALSQLEDICQRQQEQLEALRESGETAADNGEAMSEQLTDVLQTVKELNAGIDDIRQLMIRSQLAALPEDPRYQVNRFPPAKLYAEYLAANDDLWRDFFLPHSWIDYLEGFAVAPRVSTLFVCSDAKAVSSVVKLLSQDRGDGPKRLVAHDALASPGALAGWCTKPEDGDLLIVYNPLGYLSEAVEHCLSQVVGESALDIVIDQGPCERHVKMQLQKFSLCYITANATALTAGLSAVFPNEVVIANLTAIHECAAVGRIARRYALDLDYPAACLLVSAAKALNLMPEILAETACREHPELVRDLAAGRIPIAEFIKKLEPV